MSSYRLIFLDQLKKEDAIKLAVAFAYIVRQVVLE